MRLSMVVLAVAALLQSPPPVRTVGKGSLSEIGAPRQVTLRSIDEWSALWKAHGGDGQPPAVDFSREMIVGVFLGTRPTAGYGVEIVRTVAAPTLVIVEYIETGPPRDALLAQVLTAPYHLAAVPRHEGDVMFRKVEK
ncbi:MAG TPA: protease complex subunit PrcB family protein [Vicinamibacterales bacterium]|nr:protease complex subunit PrcB family protein [Vicinamibacterales bacterium]